MSYVARAITGVAGRYVELTGVRAENEALHRENRQLRTELMEMRRLAEESGRYQRLLGLRDATPAETIAARVIAVDASPYFRVARVDIDRGEGTVRRGMPVLTPEGVVGRDQPRRRARARTCCCWSIRARRWTSIVPRTGGRGILRGKSGENGYRCSIEYLARGEPVEGGRRRRHERRGRRVPAQPGGRARHAHHPGRGRPVPGRRGHARRRLRAPDRRAGRGRAAAGARSRSRPRTTRPGAVWRCIK